MLVHRGRVCQHGDPDRFSRLHLDELFEPPQKQCRDLFGVELFLAELQLGEPLVTIDDVESSTSGEPGDIRRSRLFAEKPLDSTNRHIRIGHTAAECRATDLRLRTGKGDDGGQVEGAAARIHLCDPTVMSYRDSRPDRADIDSNSDHVSLYLENV